jgi:hypothetical protein
MFFALPLLILVVMLIVILIALTYKIWIYKGETRALVMIAFFIILESLITIIFNYLDVQDKGIRGAFQIAFLAIWDFILYLCEKF